MDEVGLKSSWIETSLVQLLTMVWTHRARAFQSESSFLGLFRSSKGVPQYFPPILSALRAFPITLHFMQDHWFLKKHTREYTD